MSPDLEPLRCASCRASGVRLDLDTKANPPELFCRRYLKRPTCDWGDAMDNAADRQRHGRYARGSGHPGARLTEEQVRLILEQRNNGVPVKALASLFAVSVSTVEAIIYGKLWRHVVEFKRVTP